MRAFRAIAIAILLIGGLIGGASAVAAQQPKKEPVTPPRTKFIEPAPAAKPDAKPQAQPPAIPQPAPEQILYLIRTALLTLNDANRAGNYSVMRDLAAPGFRDRHSTADLAQIFADLRQRRFDLAAVALIAPQLTQAPVVDGNGLLRLTGVFPTQPQLIQFDLLYQVVETEWRVFGIAVSTPDAPPPNAAAPAAAPPAPAAPAAPAPAAKP